MTQEVQKRGFEYCVRAVYDFEASRAVAYQSEQRIIDAERGVLLPKNYMFIAEQSSRCVSLFKYAYLGAGSAARHLDERGMAFDWISVYLPLRALVQKTFVPQLEKYCAEAALPLSRVCFELSPTLSVDRNAQMDENLAEIKKRGARISLMDFGSAYSAVSKIGDCNEDYLILDKSFASSVLRGGKERAVTETMIDLAKKLNVKLIVDAVDSERQAMMFLDLGCNIFLGDYFGKFESVALT